MERFVLVHKVPRRQLERANAVRLYLWVVTIADLVHALNSFIPDNTLTGKWQAGSDFDWPHQERPPAKAWAVFWKLLWQSFYTQTPSSQPARFSMTLDQQLGAWLPVQRNTWWPHYRTETTLISHGKETGLLREFTRRGSDFHKFARGLQEVPLSSHPTSCTQISKRVW